MSTPALSIAVTRTRAALAALEGDWDALWRDAGDAPFQSPAWLMPWWDAFAAGELCVVTCREGGDLVALAPLFVVQRAAQRPREVQLLGTGNTDYLDVIAEPGYEHACTAAMVGVLTHRSDWDVCDLRHLRASSPLLALETPVGWIEDDRQEEPCPVVDLAARLPRSIADDVAYGLRRAARDGGLTIRHATEHSVEHDLEVLFALHATRWRQRGSEGVVSDPAARAFHLTAAGRLARRSMLQLITVWIGSFPVAAHYGFVHGQRAYLYLGGFDPAYGRFNAGKIGIAAALGDARERNAGWFDFLGGSEAYKYEWGATDEPRRRRLMQRSLHRRT